MPRLSIALAAAALAVAAGPAAAHDPGAHRAEPAQYQLHDPANCFCRAQGRTFAVGETACLRTGEGPRVAECGMVLNNTSWQFSDTPCVVSSSVDPPADREQAQAPQPHAHHHGG